MYKREDGRYINAGTNEFYRYGKKAQEKVSAYLTANENGFLSMPVDGGKYYTIGTSIGKYGEFAKFGDEFLSVNRIGNVWAKVGTRQAEIFSKMVNRMLAEMRQANKARFNDADEEEGE